MLGLVAEASGHPAAARLHGRNLQSRNHPEHFLDRGHGIEGFLMAVAMEEDVLPGLLELELARLARKEFLEQQGVLCERLRIGIFQEDPIFVAEGEETGRLETDHGDTALYVGPQRVQR